MRLSLLLVLLARVAAAQVSTTVLPLPDTAWIGGLTAVDATVPVANATMCVRFIPHVGITNAVRMDAVLTAPSGATGTSCAICLYPDDDTSAAVAKIELTGGVCDGAHQPSGLPAKLSAAVTTYSITPNVPLRLCHTADSTAVHFAGYAQSLAIYQARGYLFRGPDSVGGACPANASCGGGGCIGAQSGLVPVVALAVKTP